MPQNVGQALAGLEGGNHQFQEAERAFYRSFATILQHLTTRALKAEARVLELQTELQTRREQVEYMSDKIAQH